MQVMFEVHNQLGPGFPEEVYERAAVFEFKTQGVPVEEQKTVQVKFKGQLVGTFRLDLVVDAKIILELKAVSALNDVYRQQLLSYLKATGLRLGILVNFGAGRVEAVGVVN
ncbi:MAG: GxxExxY protein [Chloroflexi bacterium]|nr:GxxExxY protein [Chloroflexota bacterium]